MSTGAIHMCVWGVWGGGEEREEGKKEGERGGGGGLDLLVVSPSKVSLMGTPGSHG